MFEPSSKQCHILGNKFAIANTKIQPFSNTPNSFQETSHNF